MIWRRLALALVVCLLVGALGLAATWPRDDQPGTPDAVVVLGGGGPERAELGIELRDQHASVLVLSTSAATDAARLDVECDGTSVQCVTPDPWNTIGEARATAILADRHGWQHVAVVTTAFHTTRARVVFRQCLGDRVSVLGAETDVGHQLRPWRDLREAVGTLASLTVRRAC